MQNEKKNKDNLVISSVLWLWYSFFNLVWQDNGTGKLEYDEFKQMLLTVKSCHVRLLFDISVCSTT